MKQGLKTTIDTWKQTANKLKAETQALYLAYKHPDTPWYAKVFAGMVVAYAFSPIDLVPDFIPVLGYVDDLILVPMGVAFAFKMIPATVMDECRTRAKNDMLEGKPVNWAAAIFIGAVWVGLLLLCISWAADFF
jgi:uncharacterized membrane protein YkvA (DUF1232 family)